MNNHLLAAQLQGLSLGAAPSRATIALSLRLQQAPCQQARLIRSGFCRSPQLLQLHFSRPLQILRSGGAARQCAAAHRRPDGARRARGCVRCQQSASGKDSVPAPGAGGEDPEAAVLLVACAIGLATGTGVVLFNDAVHVIRGLAWQGSDLGSPGWSLWARQLPLATALPMLLLPPAAGGLVVGLLRRAAGGFDSTPPASKPAQPVEAAGQVPPVEAVRGALRPVAKAAAAAVTLGTGASLGPEGPSVEIGRAVAGALGNLLRSKEKRLTPLLAAGCGAGVAAGFNAPIAGVFFAVETVLQLQRGRDAQAGGLTLASVLLAAVLAAVVSQAGLGQAPAFTVPPYELQELYELPAVAGLGALCGLISAAFALADKVGRNAADAARAAGPGLPGEVWPALGGLAVGGLALAYPEVLYQGFANVNVILQGRADYAPGLLLQILAVKVVATTISRNSGLVGGLYAPSIFMGATLGSAYGGLAGALGGPLGLAVAVPQAYALVGVAAMLAAVCRVPLTSVLLLFEMTRDYEIIIPTLSAVGLAYWVAYLPAKQWPALFDMAAPPAPPPPRPDSQPAPQPVAAAAAALPAPGPGPASPASAAQSAAPALGAAAPAPPAAAWLADLTLACALEDNCTLLPAGTPLAEALATIDEAGSALALVTDEDGSVVGAVTRDAILRQIAAASASGSLELEQPTVSLQCTTTNDAASNGSSPGGSHHSDSGAIGLLSANENLQRHTAVVADSSAHKQP